jgi:azurin
MVHSDEGSVCYWEDPETMRAFRVTALFVSLCAALALPAVARAQGRTVEVVGTDNMKYSVATITAKAGETLTIRLKSTGQMPKIAMAHNVVVLKAGTDAAAFANASAMHRAAGFIAPQLKDQVIAASALAGAGETVDVTFTVPAAGRYQFICTFPGHFVAGMVGTLVVS